MSDKERSLAERAVGGAERAGGGAEPAVVVQRAYELSLWLLQKTETFPRSYRFSMGDRITARALDILEALAAAAYAQDKRAPLEEANRAINSLRLLLRLAVDLRLLSNDSQEFAATRLEEVGRMTGGWRKTALRSPK